MTIIRSRAATGTRSRRAYPDDWNFTACGSCIRGIFSKTEIPLACIGYTHRFWGFVGHRDHPGSVAKVFIISFSIRYSHGYCKYPSHIRTECCMARASNDLVGLVERP